MLNAKLEIAETTLWCLYLACRKLRFYKVTPAFICASHPATHGFPLAVLAYFWDCHHLGTGGVSSFLTGIASVFALSRSSSASPLSFC